MRKRTWNTTLIVVRPESANVVKFRFTKTAFVLLGVACVVAFVLVVVLQRIAPPVSMDSERHRLQQENHQLKATNVNVATGAAVVEPQVDHLEQQAQEILKLINEDDSQPSTEQ